MATKQIRINKTRQVEEFLNALRMQYKLLSDAELMKVALSLAYDFLQRKRIDAWIDSLPTIELTDEEQESLSEGIRSLNEERAKGGIRTMSVEEIMAETDPDH